MKDGSEQQIELSRMNEGLYHSVIEEFQDYAIILMDREGLIQRSNKGTEKLTLYKENEIQGKHFGIFYAAEDLKAKVPQQLVDEAIANGSVTREGRQKRKDESEFWGSTTVSAVKGEENALIGFTMVIKGLTGQKTSQGHLEKYVAQLEQKIQLLKKSEEQYHQMIGEVQDYAIIFLDVEGNIRNWNTGAEFIKGYSADIIGKNFRIFYTREDQESNLPQKLLDRAKHAGKATLEGWRVRKDGSRFWGSIVITALHDKEGRLIGFSKVTRDLTDRKLAEDKLLAYNSELESKNRELEQFAFIASHDLQEPLRKIRTFAEVAQRNIKNEDVAHQYLEKITGSAERMTTLMRSVVNYTRLMKEPTEPNEVNLNEILSQVQADLELIIKEKNAKIISDALPVVKGNPLQLTQLFSNLIANALKFSDDAAELIIESNVVRRDKVLDCPEYLTDRNYHELLFIDHGIGFDQQYNKLIFNMFQRLHAKEEYSGAGVGLALCRKIVENHKGHIAARSEIGKGTTFYVYLPVDLLESGSGHTT
jgi:PAS domain S-box-containing protein